MKKDRVRGTPVHSLSHRTGFQISATQLVQLLVCNSCEEVLVMSFSVEHRVFIIQHFFHTIECLPKTGRPFLYSDEIIEEVISKCKQNWNISICQATAMSGRSVSTSPIMFQKFGLKPYRFSILHELKGTHSPKLFTFCTWFE